MRLLLAVAVVALAAVVGLLWSSGERERLAARPEPAAAGGPAAPAAPPPSSPPRVADRIARLGSSPAAQELLAEFVARCVEIGPPAVGELARRLRDEPDLLLGRGWRTEDGFPSLRAAYLAALLGIEGPEARDALLGALELAASPEEALYVARGLHERGDGGWAEAALDHAARPVTPAHQATQVELARLAARAAPEATARLLVARAPRGEDPADPKVLAATLEDLPLAAATEATRRLVRDPEVTDAAKDRYLRAYTARREPEAIRELRELAGRDLPLGLRLSIAWKAATAPAFHYDLKERELAAAAGSAEADRIRARYLRRLEEAELLLRTALPDLADDDPRRASIARRLEERRASLR